MPRSVLERLQELRELEKKLENELEREIVRAVVQNFDPEKHFLKTGPVVLILEKNWDVLKEKYRKRKKKTPSTPSQNPPEDDV